MLKNELAIILKLPASSSEVAREWLIRFAEITQKDVTPALANIWAEQLQDIAPDALERACDRLMKRWTTGFLPVPGNIREIVQKEAGDAELRRLFEREEQKRCEAVLEYQRAIAYAEHKRENLLPAPRPAVDMTDAVPIRETPRVIDFEGRSAELQRQAKQIQEKYPTKGGEISTTA